MAILVIADHDGASLRDTTLKTIKAAQLIAQQVDVLVYGEGVFGVADGAGKAEGVRHVLLSESAELKAEIAETVCDLITGLAGDYDTIAIPATTSGKDIAPRVAARLGVSLISDVTDVLTSSTFVRPIYAGNALETVQTAEAIRVLTVRPTAFASVAAIGGSAGITRVAAPAAKGRTRFISEEKVVSDRPDLGAARIVVSGGRALGSADEFKAVLEPL
ncbi:MAG: electron transfer flavoprotein subunit alpha/FixB family protein, partial [Asticcacaulis sp.]|nr:electron transfer flavoprotein subunit alpha/FixB family protein [Asticcacaulis sp.]